MRGRLFGLRRTGWQYSAAAGHWPLFDNYQTIFSQRARSYHDAMVLAPDARREEFESVVKLLSPQNGDVLIDLPAGGGYLSRYVSDAAIEYHAIETSAEFFDQCPDSKEHFRHLTQLDELPHESRSTNLAVSLAAMHHIDNREQFLGEIHRVLRPGGKLLIADVALGSSTDRFLNEFVHQSNSMGHEGVFLTKIDRERLNDCGFKLIHDEEHTLSWHFESPAVMGQFAQLLFGLDQCNQEAVISGIREILGFRQRNGKIEMNWPLTYLVAVRR